MPIFRLCLFIALATCLPCTTALAAPPAAEAAAAAGKAGAGDAFTLSIRDHRFEPTELVVPANRKFKLVVRNEDPTPEEFESRSLRREKMIAGKGEIVLNLGPLPAGQYDFFGELHEATAKGRLIAE